MLASGRFIVIDGLNGAGKSTQIGLLKKHFEGQPVVFTREPGGTSRAEKIRELILAKEYNKPGNITADFFLFAAAREEHIRYMIYPALMAGIHVITDRYDSSSMAFQVFAGRKKFLEEWLWTIRSHQIVVPDQYIILDLPAQEARKRCLNAHKSLEKFDMAPIEDYERSRAGFQAFHEALNRPRRPDDLVSTMVNANRSISEVWVDVRRLIEEQLQKAKEKRTIR